MRAPEEEWVQIPAIDPNQNWTLRDCQVLLTRLFNAVAQAELTMRKLLQQQADATLAYERAHVIATTDPACPVPNRSDVTVGIRDAWIRGMELDEFDALNYSKLNVEMQRRYMDRLEQQASLVQSLQKNVLADYVAVGTAEGVRPRW